MPTISLFYGIAILMRWREHNPPHFHARYAGYDAQFDIRTLELIEGNLPRHQKVLVLKWADQHRKELLDAWTACSQKKQPKRISPLA